jgi:hypothetical protein
MVPPAPADERLSPGVDHFPGPTSGRKALASKFSVGDHVRWNSEAGHVEGRITKVHTADVEYKGHVHRCTADEPQYEIKSDKTGHVAMHKGEALSKI